MGGHEGLDYVRQRENREGERERGGMEIKIERDRDGERGIERDI